MYYWKALPTCWSSVRIQRLFVTFHCSVSSFILTWVGIYSSTLWIYTNYCPLLHYHDSGHAPGLPTVLKPTLHTALVQVATPTGVVFGIGEDAEEPDTSKRWIFCSYLHHMTVTVACMHVKRDVRSCYPICRVMYMFAHSWVCTCYTAGQIQSGTQEHITTLCILL